MGPIMGVADVAPRVARVPMSARIGPSCRPSRQVRPESAVPRRTPPPSPPTGVRPGGRRKARTQRGRRKNSIHRMIFHPIAGPETRRGKGIPVQPTLRRFLRHGPRHRRGHAMPRIPERRKPHRPTTRSDRKCDPGGSFRTACPTFRTSEILGAELAPATLCYLTYWDYSVKRYVFPYPPQLGSLALHARLCYSLGRCRSQVCNTQVVLLVQERVTVLSFVRPMLAADLRPDN